jgi:toxin ParE1/3/4
VAHRIVWLADARRDLINLYDWIADQANSDTAFSYTSRIESHAAKLAEFPRIGTPRDDLAAGMRTITYRRRTVIAYQIVGDDVEVLRIFHGGRELRLGFDE